ncbi:MAG: hypothetical protein Q7O66_16860 [Dehalococcoidia bacterium]|nr:hypothetical protein [Dehalococcoidia bacterium]
MVTELERKREYWLDDPSKFYRHSRLQKGFVEVDGEPLQIDGFGEMDVFIWHGPFGWAIYCGITGTLLFPSGEGRYSTQREAITRATAFMHDLYGANRELLLKDRQDRISELGLSPRYRWEVTPE